MEFNLISMPITYGCDEAGVDLAFDKLMSAKLTDLFKIHNHQINETIKINVDQVLAKDKYQDHLKLKYLSPITKANEALAKAVYQSLKNGKFPFVIGGDHSLALGSIAGASKYFKKFAVIYIDAHGDFNTIATSTSHNIHGMPLASAMDLKDSPMRDLFYPKQKLKPQDLYHLGAHDIDPGEYQLAKALNLDWYPLAEIRKQGLENVLDQQIKKLLASGYEGVHLSFDIDCLKGNLVPGTGYCLSDGFNLAQVKIILKRFLETGLIKSLDFVEYNPLLDDDQEKTLKLALDLIDHILAYL